MNGKNLPRTTFPTSLSLSDTHTPFYSVFDLEHDEARSIGVRTPPRTRREARAPEITKGKNKFRLSRPMHATDKRTYINTRAPAFVLRGTHGPMSRTPTEVEEARNPGKAAAKAKKQQRKKATSKRVKRSRGDAKSEGPSKRQRGNSSLTVSPGRPCTPHSCTHSTTTCTGTAPSAKKRLSLPKGPVGRSTTGVRKPRVVPEVEAIKADGLSDETKINALMLRLRLGSEVRWLWLPSKGQFAHTVTTRSPPAGECTAPLFGSGDCHDHLTSHCAPLLCYQGRWAPGVPLVLPPCSEREPAQQVSAAHPALPCTPLHSL